MKIRSKKEEIEYLNNRLGQVHFGIIDAPDALYSIWLHRMLVLDPTYKKFEGVFYEQV